MLMGLPECARGFSSKAPIPTCNPEASAEVDALFLLITVVPFVVYSLVRRTEMSQSETQVLDLRNHGYGGWLAFFCVVQIYIHPIFTIVSGVFSLLQVAPLLRVQYYASTCLGGHINDLSPEGINNVSPYF